MPWSKNSGGPWGGGSSGGGDGGGKNPWGTPPPNGGGGGNGSGPQPPNLDELFRQSQERLKRTFGGGGGGGGGGGISKAGILLVALIAIAVWVYASIFQVEQNEKAVVLTFGEYSDTKGAGLNFAFWPFQTHQTIQTTTNRTVGIGVPSSQRTGARDNGLMLTGDENVVDVEFKVVWNVKNAKDYLFELARPDETIQAVSEASIREVLGRSKIDPVLQRDEILTDNIKELIQGTLDGYKSGVNIERVNFDAVSPPNSVIEAFDSVTKATQQNQKLKLDAEGFRFQKLADARAEAAELKEQADGYALRVENEARGEAARFESIYEEYKKAPEVTRKRLYLETMERVFGDINKVILDESGGGSGGVVPYLPLNELRPSGGKTQ